MECAVSSTIKIGPQKQGEATGFLFHGNTGKIFNLSKISFERTSSSKYNQA
jgi:hypothetical protein